MDKAIIDVVSTLGNNEIASWRMNVECRKVGGLLYTEASEEEKAEICMWQSFVASKPEDEIIMALDKVLRQRTFVVGHRLSLADIVCYIRCATTSAPVAVLRWLNLVQKITWTAAPNANLPQKLDLQLPANISGPLPLPIDKRQKNHFAKVTQNNSDISDKIKAKETIPTHDKKKKEKKKAPTPAVAPIDDSDVKTAFAALDVRVGQIIEAWPHPEADKLFCEKIDIGEEQPRTIASGLRAHYSVEDLTNRHVLIFANLKARTMQGFRSEGMVLCAATADHSIVKFLEPPADAAIGSRVYLDGTDPLNLLPAATPSQVQKKKLLESVLPSLCTDADGVACCDGKPFLLPDKGSPVTAPLKNAPIS